MKADINADLAEFGKRQSYNSRAVDMQWIIWLQLILLWH